MRIRPQGKQPRQAEKQPSHSRLAGARPQETDCANAQLDAVAATQALTQGGDSAYDSGVKIDAEASALRAYAIGGSPPRREGPEKVRGQALYVDDLPADFFGTGEVELVHGVTVRSPVARGRLRAIGFLPGVPWDEIVVVTAADIPGQNHIALLENDQPCLVSGLINHAEEPLLILGHPDRVIAERARTLVRLEIDPLPPQLDLDDSLRRGTKPDAGPNDVIWGKDNVFKTFTIEKGDVAAAWAGVDVIVEGDYETGAQEQLYIEPQGMLARVRSDGSVEVFGSLQCPYYVHAALMAVFNLPADKVRIVQTETGGGFGGKEEYPSMIAAHTALLARKAGRPAKIVYDRLEDMVATTKRHPSRTHIKTGWRHDGTLVVQDIDFRLDGGAYMTLSPVVLSRGGLHAAGPYACDHVRVRARAAATNMPPHGAFRGFGAPQSVFAIERHMDEAAAKLGMSEIALRKKNLVRDGQTLSTGQVLRERVDMRALLDRALALSGYEAKRARYDEENRRAAQGQGGMHAQRRRGIGVATFMHGAGFTGSGERYLASKVTVDCDATGQVHVRASSTEIGQGTNTIFTQIAAEILGLPPDAITVVRPDTSQVPNSGPTVASRTVMVVGGLVARACQQLKTRLVEAGQGMRLAAAGYRPQQFRAAVQAYLAQHGTLSVTTEYEPPPDVQWDDKAYRGDAYATYAWAAYVAEVEVDLVSYETRVLDFVAVQEVGKVVHPILAAGQIEGGVAQGVGFALYEKVAWREGRMANGQMTNYIMPTSADVPPIRVEFIEVENPRLRGPGGAKGIGELPLDGTAPAILNAVAQATGLRLNQIPLLPEDLLAAYARAGLENG